MQGTVGYFLNTTYTWKRTMSDGNRKQVASLPLLSLLDGGQTSSKSLAIVPITPKPKTPTTTVLPQC